MLTAILGVVAGGASVGAGCIFTAATTALSVANIPQKVLARVDDEVWHVEEIGRSGNEAVHISSFFLADPFRLTTLSKGWLIHEERRKVIL